MTIFDQHFFFLRYKCEYCYLILFICMNYTDISFCFDIIFHIKGKIWANFIKTVSVKFVSCRNVCFKINESRYIVLFVVSGSIKKLISIDYVNIYLFSIFFSIKFAWWKSLALPNILLLWFINFKNKKNIPLIPKG